MALNKNTHGLRPALDEQTGNSIEAGSTESFDRTRLSGRVFDFRQIPQGAHDQKNKTVGAVVPLGVLRREMKVSEFAVRQLRLDFLGKHGETA